jgi:tRNA(Ile)-lysidine synthase
MGLPPCNKIDLDKMRKTLPHALIVKTSAFLSQHRMLDGVRRLGVAVSGGADSMALLHVLYVLCAERQIELTVLHVNHGLRGTESDADESLVREEAARLRMPLYVHSIEPGLAPSTGVELWARNQRLLFFNHLMAELPLDRVATGHTQRDQAETVLFRLLRGAGPQGLGGISPVSARGFIRPLLSASREEVLGFLTETSLRWREDASNEDSQFARNRLRNEWLPALREAWNPKLDRALAQTAEILSQESDFLDRIADEEATRQFTGSPFGWEASVDALRTIHPALLRRLLRRMAARTANAVPEFRHLERIYGLAVGPKASGLFRSQGLLAERSGGAFRIARAEPETALRFDGEAIAIEGPGRYSLPGIGGVFELVQLPEKEQSMNGFNGLNSGYTGGWSVLRPLSPGCVLLLRVWRPGDVFRPLGSNSSRKLKELFQQGQVPRWRRLQAVVLDIDGEIAWCRYLGPSAGYVAQNRIGTDEFVSQKRSFERPGVAIRYVEPFESKENG